MIVLLFHMIFSIDSPVFPLFLDGFPMKFPMVCHGHGLREVRATGMDAGGGAGWKYDRLDFLDEKIGHVWGKLRSSNLTVRYWKFP